MNTQTLTVRVVSVERGNGRGIFPTGTIWFRRPDTGERECIAMRPTLEGVKPGDWIEIDFRDLDGDYDAVEGARIVGKRDAE